MLSSVAIWAFIWVISDMAEKSIQRASSFLPLLIVP